jgi:hypothetical protein
MRKKLPPIYTVIISALQITAEGKTKTNKTFLALYVILTQHRNRLIVDECYLVKSCFTIHKLRTGCKAARESYFSCNPVLNNKDLATPM